MRWLFHRCLVNQSTHLSEPKELIQIVEAIKSNTSKTHDLDLKKILTTEEQILRSSLMELDEVFGRAMIAVCKGANGSANTIMSAYLDKLNQDHQSKDLNITHQKRLRMIKKMSSRR